MQNHSAYLLQGHPRSTDAAQPPGDALRDFLRCAAASLGDPAKSGAAASHGPAPAAAAPSTMARALALSRVADAAADAGLVDDADEALQTCCRVSPSLARSARHAAQLMAWPGAASY